jgi:predicted metalloprotease
VRIRTACSLVIAAGLLAACAATDPGVSATRSRQSTGGPLIPSSTNPDDPPATTVPLDVEQGVIDFGSAKPPQPYDAFLVASFKDIEQFWQQEFPAVYGSDFAPLAGGIFAAYPGRPEPIPGCGTAETTFADVEGNAFYCRLGDFMVYDDSTLLPGLVDELGEAAVAVVLAHEFGHAVQFRADEFGQPVILKEQQADCFAGAWAARAARGESDVVFFNDNDVRGGLIAMIKVADPVELGGQGDEDAHGTGFDRVGAFQDGFVGGPAACKPFFDDGRNLIDIPFDFEDPNLGNLPFDTPDDNDIVTLIPADLTRFWTEQMTTAGVTFTPPTVLLYPTEGPFPACDGVTDDAYPRNSFWCASTNQIMLDADFGAELAANPLLGDMSVGYLLAQGFSEAVQSALASDLTGEPRVLFDDCLTGSWVKDIVPPIPTDRVDPLFLSAGDLDEAIVTAIVRSDETADTNVRGSAFEKIDAFRAGVLGGIGACADRLG